ncbi:MAG TPA: adenylosuccinate lyase, partial [Bacillota bacterium]
YSELQRDIERLERAREAVRVGKLSGAVGNFAHIDPEVERRVCAGLGLEPAPVSTQVLQRDRHAEFMTTLAVVGGTLEKIAVEIRHLQRTEVREVEEPFRSGQKGSSAMPHKRNPEKSERISGLARVLRANALAALENQALWHERDISHSSVERVILPDSTILLDYMLHLLTGIVRDLHVYPEAMSANLERTGGLIYSQRLLLALVAAGMTREDAYALVQELAMAAWQGGATFRERVLADPRVTGRIEPGALRALFDPAHYLRRVDHVYRRLGLEPA